MEGPAPSPWRMPMLIAGWALIAVAPIVGLLPGPGGVFVFGAGAAIILRNSKWAKRRYVWMKQRWPRLGQCCDWALRRASARRRRQLAEAGKPD